MLIDSLQTGRLAWPGLNARYGESRYAVSGPGLKLDIVSIECRCCRYLGKLLVLHEEKPVEQFGGEVIEGFTEADDVQTVVTVASPNGAESIEARYCDDVEFL